MRFAYDATILITGAEGFVGLHLVEHLLQAGYTNVHGTCYRESSVLQALLGVDHVHALDLADMSAVVSLLQTVQPASIVHLASLAFVGDSFTQAQRVMNTNTDLQYVMLEAVRQHASYARVISIGSAAEYGLVAAPHDPANITEDVPHRPTNPYAVSKLTQDYLAAYFFEAYGLDIIRVRPFNQIGPRQTTEFAVPAFAQQIVRVERGEQPAVGVGNLSAVRDFTDVRDAARAYEVLLQRATAGEVYNLGSGVGVSMQRVLDELIQASGREILVQEEAERLRPIDVPVFIANVDKLKQLGWEPSIPRKQTLHDILEYERNQTK